MSRFISSFMCVMLLLVSFGCSSSGFLVIQDAPKGAQANQTLGLRAVVDTGSVTPTERYSWLELCDKVVTPTLKFFSSTNYVNCEPQVSLTQVAQKTTTTGWVAGVVGPVIQTGMVAASVAYAGHEIGRGIGRSGSTENETINNGNSNSNSASQGQGQGQGQFQGQKQKGGNATGGNATNSNTNTNGNNANGGQGGNGGNGHGGNGGNGQGGNGGGGGNGGNGGNGGGASTTGCSHSGGQAHDC